jgi:predicted transcriptional regulator
VEEVAMRQFGDLEAAVIERLWHREDPATVREVLENLNGDDRRGRTLAYTTVMTVMDNLHRKGVLRRESFGRAYRYTPVRSREEHVADLIAADLADSDDRAAPLLLFIEQLTPAEVAKLRSALEATELPQGRPGRRYERGTGSRRGGSS